MKAAGIAVALLILVSLSSCSNLRQASAVDRLKPCKSGEGPSDAYCGTLDVWEDRTAKSGRKIALKILVLPALKQKYSPDPLFFLAGGPGQGAAELAGVVEEPYRRIETDRDLVFVDQRGTGKSNPLECKPAPEEREDDDDDDNAGARFEKRLRTCLDSYKNKADVTKYTTSIAMDDLDEVRAYLGYGKINLYGGSYGTRAAIVYTRQHPENTRAVILDGVAPTDMRLPLYMARDGQRALDLLLDACAKDSGCNQRFPNLRQRLTTLLDKLGVHPQKVRYVNPRTGVEKEMDARRLLLAGSLSAALYSPTISALVPLLIEQAEKGNFGGLLAMGSGFDPDIAQGMYFSVTCSEDAPRITKDLILKEAAGTFMGPELLELRGKACAFWPRGQVDASYYDIPPSDIPALILSGEVDPVTPPVWGEQVASKWKNSRHIIVPNTGHGTWNTGCVMKLMAQFLNDGSAAKLDAGCVAGVKRPQFFLGPAGPDPMGGAAAK